MKECLKMGCWTVIKSFHVKIILLDKQELIQEVQVRLRADILARVRYPSQGQISWPGADILARGRYPGQWQISWTGADILARGKISWPGADILGYSHTEVTSLMSPVHW